MNISLPPDLKNWLNAQVREGGFSTASEYVRDVLRRMRERQQRRRIDALIIEGIESGVGGIMDERYWTKLRSDARRAAGVNRRAKASPRVALEQGKRLGK